MKSKKILQRKFANKIKKTVNEDKVLFYGWAGDGNGNVRADSIGNIYIRDLNKTKITKVFCAIYPILENSLIEIGRKKNSKLTEVLRIVNYYPKEMLPSEQQDYPESFTWPNINTVYIARQQILIFLGIPKGDYKIEIHGGIYQIENTRHLFQTQTIDLEAEVIDDGAKWCVVDVDDEGTISYRFSDLVENKDLLTYEDIPEPLDDKFSLIAVKLYAGQSTFYKNKNEQDIIDLTLYGNGSGGGSLPTLDPNSVVITDSSGNIITDSKALYDLAINLLSFGESPLGIISTLEDAITFMANDGVSAQNFLFTYGTGVANRFAGITGRGTKASPTALQEDDVIVRFSGRFHYDSGGTPTATQVEIRFVVDGAPASGDYPTRIEFWTTPDGSSTLTKVATIGSDGVLTLDEYGSGAITGTPAYALAVDSSGKVIETALGGGSDWELIADVTLGSDTANFDFTSIPSTYKHLKLLYSLRTDRASFASDRIKVIINNDTASNKYESILYYWFHTSTWGTIDNGATTYAACTFVCASTALANSFGGGFIEFPDYANTTNLKLFQTRGGQMQSTTIKPEIYDGMAVWRDTSAINRITVAPIFGSNFKAGSRISLYGLK